MTGFLRRSGRWTLLVAILFVTLTTVRGAVAETPSLPAFKRDTVLVWKIDGPTYEKSFVARLASFRPDRFLEWENGKGQGTVLMPERSLLEARGYESSSLFVDGMDKTGRNVTVLWLSRRVFTELMEKKSARMNLDGVMTRLRLLGTETIAVAVNRADVELPVIRVADDRNAEWCFLDDPDNPLMICHEVRDYRQTLFSITTNQTDTLRWIKGSRLKNHPQP